MKSVLQGLKGSFIVAFLVIIGQIQAQILEPVKWETTYQINADGTGQFVYEAKIDEGWTVYSVFVDPDAGPFPTEVTYEEQSDNLTIKGDPVEIGDKKEGKDPMFDNAILAKFTSKKPYRITQDFALTGSSAKAVGYLTFMTCNDEKCLPPNDIDFTFDIKKPTAVVSEEKEVVKESKRTVVETTKKPVVVQTKIKESPIKKEAKKPAVTLNDLRPEEDESISDSADPITWSKSVIEKEDGVFEVVLKGVLQDGWNIYSYYTDDGGPLPTILEMNDENDFLSIDKPTESGELKEGKDALFQDVTVKKFLSNKPYTYTQIVKPKETTTNQEAFLSYMVCNDTKCIPFDKEYTLDFENIEILDGLVASTLSSGHQSAFNNILEGNIIDQRRETIMQTYKQPIAQCESGVRKADGYIQMFVFGFLGGLLALLTPCVFPMIPLTVSFFTKDNKRKGWVNGLIYGASIVIIYVTIGILLTAFFGEEVLNRLSTNWIANTLFFVIFVVFAFSFFGFYEIQLPSSWANKTDKYADKGGFIGIFFMAFTLSLVSFSCTGPIIGTAIVQAAANQVGPAVVMTGFALALAIPFGLFAAFPSWLNSIPKSGSWMNSVKVVLGFLELALAFKFLSVADMTNHWGFLRYELFMALWILIFALMALFLFGIIRFPHDSPIKKLSKTRWAFGLGAAAFVIYLCTGFIYNSDLKSYNALKLMSGLAPPTQYNYLLDEPEIDPILKAKYPSYSKCSNNIDCFKDYYEGLQYAQEIGKPIFLDFTGYGCVNCRKTEEHIWVNEDVRSKLQNEFVMVSLYVDDDTKLEKRLQSKTRNKALRNVGNKWADFQISNFQQNSQPLYVMMTPQEEVIAEPRGYQDGVNSYNKYLDCGLKAYNSQN